MAEWKVYAYELNANAGASGKVDAVTIPSARNFTLRKVTFVFPTGSNFLLQVRIMWGDDFVIPDKGYIVGDGNVIPVSADIKYQGGQAIIVWYNNTDTANSHKCLIIFEGVLE